MISFSLAFELPIGLLLAFYFSALSPGYAITSFLLFVSLFFNIVFGYILYSIEQEKRLNKTKERNFKI
jgi:hypothetical protein